MTAGELENLEAKVVDARGVSCPGPLLEAKKGIGTVPVGGTIEIWSSDPGTRNDIPAWCRKVGHDFRGVIEAEGYDRIFVTRKK
jgi:tRNA 2-thiouridine synthesizing protein A